MAKLIKLVPHSLYGKANKLVHHSLYGKADKACSPLANKLVPHSLYASALIAAHSCKLEVAILFFWVSTVFFHTNFFGGHTFYSHQNEPTQKYWDFTCHNSDCQ